MTQFTCTIRTCTFETDSPMGMTAHAVAHRNDFKRLVGRPPHEYDEVRQLFNEGVVPDDVSMPPVGRVATLDEFGVAGGAGDGEEVTEA